MKGRRKTLARIIEHCTWLRALALLSALMVACLCSAGEQVKCPLVHERAMAVFIAPTDGKIESMKKEEGEEDFYTIADDALYYQWEAAEFLSKSGFPYCFTESDSHEFITKDDRKYSVRKECPGWCLILWNGKDEPLWTNAADLFMHEDYIKGAVDHAGH